MDGWNTRFLLGGPIFRGYVSFRECNYLEPTWPIWNDFWGLTLHCGPNLPTYRGHWDYIYIYYTYKHIYIYMYIHTHLWTRTGFLPSKISNLYFQDDCPGMIVFGGSWCTGPLDYFHSQTPTPPKLNMEPENDGVQKESPFSGTPSQVPFLNFRGVSCMVYSEFTIYLPTPHLPSKLPKSSNLTNLTSPKHLMHGFYLHLTL